MSGDDWQKGDLALCVKQDSTGPRLLTVGAVYTVAGLNEDWVSDPDPQLGLFLAEVVSRGPSWDGFDSRRFRKINPLTDEERDEFLADLNVPVRAVMPLSSAGDAA